MLLYIIILCSTYQLHAVPDIYVRYINIPPPLNKGLALHIHKPFKHDNMFKFYLIVSDEDVF